MSFDCKKSEMSEGDGQVTGDSCPRVQEIRCVCVSVCVIFILYMLFACCSQVHDEIYVVHEPYKINRKQLLWCSVLVNWFVVHGSSGGGSEFFSINFLNFFKCQYSSDKPDDSQRTNLFTKGNYGKECNEPASW